MIVDMHASVIPDDPALFERLRLPNHVADPSACTVEATLRRMDALGVDMSVVWHLGLSTEECRRNNDFVASVRDRYPDRFIPFATVYPHDEEAALVEVERAARELRVAGIKVHPVVMKIALDDPRVLAVIKRVGELDLPFVTHVNPCRLQDLPDHQSWRGKDPLDNQRRSEFADEQKLGMAIAAYDSPRFQCAHMGGLGSAEIRQSHVTFQTAGAARQTIEWAVKNVGVERIVFGSDFPFFTVEGELAKVRDLDLSEADRAALLSGNAVQRVLRSAVRREA